MISIIIPTTCEAARAGLLHAAIDSVLSQQGVHGELLVVVNGQRFDPELLAGLRRRLGLRVLQIEEGNVSVARLHGLQHSTGEFFAFLDDDDEFLPGALATRLSLFEDGVDVVVTNGWEHRAGKDERLVPEAVAARIQQQPIEAFLLRNWFASPGSMFRASTVPTALFDFPLRYFEWTLLLFLLVQAKLAIRYDDCITYRKREDNPLSVSKTAEYAAAHSTFIRDRLLTLDLPADVRRALRRRYAAALHDLSHQELQAGRLRSAWWAHIECLKTGGLQFLPYTRHLLQEALA